MTRFRFSVGSGKLTVSALVVAYLTSILAITFWQHVEHFSTIPLFHNILGRILETGVLSAFAAVSLAPRKFPIERIWNSSNRTNFGETLGQHILVLLALALAVECFIQTGAALYEHAKDPIEFSKKMISAANIFPQTPTSWSLWLGADNLLSPILISPLAEEYVYRGVLLNFFLTRLRAPIAILLSSMLFGVVHAGFFSAFFGGVFLGWIYLKYGRLWMSVVIHAFTNMLLIIFYSAGGGHFLISLVENRPLGFALSLFIAIACIAACVFLCRMWTKPFPSAFG